MTFQNVVDYLLVHPDSASPAIFYRGEQITHKELRDRVILAAFAFRQIGIRTGSLVLLLGDNSIQWVVWYLALLYCGAVAVPLAANETARVKDTILRFRGLTHVLCEKKYLSFIANEEKNRSLPIYTEDLIRDFTGHQKEPWSPSENSMAAIMMTSGTTGDPKGVCVSHGNIIANTESILSYLELTSNDRMMVILPFFYCYGLSLLHTHLRAGGSVVLNNQFLFPTKVLDEMEEKACTGFAGVPSTYQILLRRSDLARRPLAALRHVQQAGGKLAVPFINELRANLPAHVRIFVMYGATEATARLSYLPPKHLSQKPGSIGLPVAGVQFEIRDEAGTPLPDGKVGELAAKGKNITSGYYCDEQLTAAKFQNGWFLTGDLGYRDSDGFYFLVGRKSEFIKTYGYRVSPKEIEEVLLSFPGIAEALVLGIPDEEAGEAIAALLAPDRGRNFQAQEIQEFCMQQLPNHKIPTRVKFVAEIPKTGTGKIHYDEAARLLIESE